MYIKVNCRNRPDCVKVTNNNITIPALFAISSTIKDALKYWEKLARNAIRLNLEDLSGTK